VLLHVFLDALDRISAFDLDRCIQIRQFWSTKQVSHPTEGFVLFIDGHRARIGHWIGFLRPDMSDEDLRSVLTCDRRYDRQGSFQCAREIRGIKEYDPGLSNVELRLRLVVRS
jgi:hypothetical protein